MAAKDPCGRRPSERINPLDAASPDIGAFAATFPRFESDRLNEPHAPTPLVLPEKHAAQLSELTISSSQTLGRFDLVEELPQVRSNVSSRQPEWEQRPVARRKPTASPLPFTHPRVWHGLGTA